MDWSSVYDDAPHKAESLAHILHSACLTGSAPSNPRYDPYPSAIPRLFRSQELIHHHGCVNTIHWKVARSSPTAMTAARAFGDPTRTTFSRFVKPFPQHLRR